MNVKKRSCAFGRQWLILIEKIETLDLKPFIKRLNDQLTSISFVLGQELRQLQKEPAQHRPNILH